MMLEGPFSRLRHTPARGRKRLKMMKHAGRDYGLGYSRLLGNVFGNHYPPINPRARSEPVKVMLPHNLKA